MGNVSILGQHAINSKLRISFLSLSFVYEIVIEFTMCIPEDSIESNAIIIVTKNFIILSRIFCHYCLLDFVWLCGAIFFLWLHILLVLSFCWSYHFVCFHFYYYYYYYWNKQLLRWNRWNLIGRMVLLCEWQRVQNKTVDTNCDRIVSQSKIIPIIK